MYNISDIKSVHFEVTSKCQARCPMCPRRINGGPLNHGVKLVEITVSQFKKWFDSKFVEGLNHFSFCGNLGDPIIAKDTMLIIEYLRSVNNLMSIHLHTNGSAKSTEWWTKLVKNNVKVIFGIDGLEDQHSRYRINTDWKKIIKNARTFIEAGGVARWDMLVFQHNEHQIEQCRILASEMGFKEFTVKHTTRFRNNQLSVINDIGKTIDILFPTEKSKNMIERVKEAVNEEKPVISCKAKKDSQIYVAATGNVTPCCWLDQEWYPPNAPSRIDYMDKIGKYPNLNQQSLEEIFNTGYFTQISNCWNDTGLKECTKQCGSFDKLNSQFVEN